MPVQSAVFKQYMIITIHFISDHEYGNKNYKYKSDNDMQGMKSGHGKIQAVKKNISIVLLVQERMIPDRYAP